jgi:integrase
MKDSSPKAKYPGIQPRFLRDAWQWRARTTIAGKQVVGEYRLAQEEAHADYVAMTGKVPTGRPMTLAEALARDAAEALARGKAPERVEVDHVRPGRRLMTFFDGRTPVRELTAADVEWYVRLCLSDRDDDGKQKERRSPNSIRVHDLPLFARVFKIAGALSPLNAVKGIPKKIRPRMAFFTADELTNIVRRMRTESLGGDGAQRQTDADIVEFLAITGMRYMEFFRVQLNDIDRVNLRIRVESKVKHMPREAVLPKEYGPLLERMIAHAKARGSARLCSYATHHGLNLMFKRWQTRLDEPRLRGRTLRHTSGTLAVQSGATLPEAAAHMGHSAVTTTALYVHALHKSQGVTASKIAGALVKARHDALLEEADERAAG